MSNEFLQSDQWNPPLPTDNTHYSFNTTKQTLGGHVFEVDDTLGNERIAEHHKSGTSRTITADGSSEITIMGDSWITIIRDGHILINGEVNVTMAKTVKLHCKKLELEVEGDMNTTVHGSYRLKVDGNYALEVVGDSSEKIAGDKISECKNLTHTVHEKVSETISSGYTGIIGGDYHMTSAGSASITGGLTGASLNSLGKVSVGGTMVGIDAIGLCSITGIAGVGITTPVLTAQTPLIVASTAIIQCLDTMSTLTGPKTLATHIHQSLGPTSPTSPPIS